VTIPIDCPRCRARYGLDPAQVRPGGTPVVCRRCGHTWKATPTGAPAPETAPAPRPAPIACPSCGHRFAPPQRRHGERYRILVAEDHDYFLEMARDALGKNFETVGVRTPTEALLEISRQRPDLLVLDLMLADGGDGLDVLRNLPGRDFPVLVFTSKNEQQVYGRMWDQLKKLGVNDVLIKGLNVADELQRKVEALLKIPA
jgi:predicted Zn finger-like uncharacterized protein